MITLWASPMAGADVPAIAEVMDDTAASIQDRLPKPFPLDVCETKFPTQQPGWNWSGKIKDGSSWDLVDGFYRLADVFC